jgi:hypothetical protein
MAPPEAATETTVTAGVEVHVQAGGGDVDPAGEAPGVLGPPQNRDVGVGMEGPSGSLLLTVTHDVGVGMEEGGVDGGLKRRMEGDELALLEPPAAKKKRNAKPFRIQLEPLEAGAGGEGGGGAGAVEGSLEVAIAGAEHAVVLSKVSPSELVSEGGAADAASAMVAVGEGGPGGALAMAALGERVAVNHDSSTEPSTLNPRL